MRLDYDQKLTTTYGDEPPPAPTTPQIARISVTGKKLIIVGERFDIGAIILLNGEPQKTKTINDEQNPTGQLIAKKSGKTIRSGDSCKFETQTANSHPSSM